MAVAASRGRLMPQPLPDRIAVVATFYPIAHFTQAVGGERVAVATLVGRGVEPHEYEPTARDRATVANANLFIIHGGSVDAWAGKMAAQLQTITVVAVSPASTDPHTWLDPLLARQMVTTIRDALIQIAPRERAFFEDTAARYLGRLAILDEDYRTALSSCRQKEFITSHDAFGVLAARYGLRAIPIAGLSPEEEPSLKQLSDIATLAKRKGHTTVFMESLASPKLAETIAREASASVQMLNPLEGLTTEEEARGATYLSIMRENLQALARALRCDDEK